ncbi:hypothetical protein EV401DRAFT_2202760 [Pisolithus croceorrhizus]|nr:hypothetical protein EV401DRAFT_2202760 [Pisolithus croceorrhizus]
MPTRTSHPPPLGSEYSPFRNYPTATVPALTFTTLIITGWVKFYMGGYQQGVDLPVVSTVTCLFRQYCENGHFKGSERFICHGHPALADDCAFQIDVSTLAMHNSDFT